MMIINKTNLKKIKNINLKIKNLNQRKMKNIIKIKRKRNLKISKKCLETKIFLLLIQYMQKLNVI